jgi:hypothetical protein
MTVGLFGHLSKLTIEFFKSCVEVGIPYVHDLNTHRGTYGVAHVRFFCSLSNESQSYAHLLSYLDNRLVSFILRFY